MPCKPNYSAAATAFPQVYLIYVEEEPTLLNHLITMNKIAEDIPLKLPGIAATSTTVADEDSLFHLAFDNSAQANIIATASTGKIIMANNAACKLLGYSKKRLLTKKRSDIFAIKESGFKKMQKQRTAEGHSVALVTAIKKSGRQLPCAITSAVFTDKDGIEKSIITITDCSPAILEQKNIDSENKKLVARDTKAALAKAAERLAENNEWIKYIAKTSYDVMWDWDISSGEIYVGDSMEEVFGYAVQNNTVNFTDFSKCLLPQEKGRVEKKLRKAIASASKNWNDSFTFKRQDGTMAAVTSRASIVRNEKGKAIRLIGALQDISRLQELERELENSITAIGLMTQGIVKQKKINAIKENEVAENIVRAIARQIDIDVANKKLVAENIVLAIARQVDIDNKNKKLVARNIAIAIAHQKDIDTAKAKTVAENIVRSIARQKEIDAKNKKRVAGNIVRARSKQKEIDKRNKKKVAENIMLAIAKQLEIDASNKKKVAENIVLAIARQLEIDARNKKLVAENIALVLSNQKNIDARKEKLVAGNIVLALLKQKEIDVRNKKKVAENIIMAQAKADALLAESSEKFLRAQKELEGKLQDEMEAKKRAYVILSASKEKFLRTTKFATDLLWEWDLKSGEISIGNNLEALFGYTLKNKKGKATDWIHRVHPDDKEKLDTSLHQAIVSLAKNWEQDFRFTRADGSIVHVVGRAGIRRHSDGKASHLVGVLEDVSKQKELEKEIADKKKLLTEYEENFKLIFNSSSDVLYDSDLVTGKVTVSDAFEKEYGYKITNNLTPVSDWISHIHPDDKQAVFENYLRMLDSGFGEWTEIYRFLRADNSVVKVKSSAIVLKNAEGKAYRVIGSMTDMSKQTMLEEKLEQEIKLKENQITAAVEEAKEAERSEIGKELHDNVNQLLGASRLYLEMAKRGGSDSEMYLSRSSEYTLSAIEEIRKLSKGLTTDTISILGLSEAIDSIARDIMEVKPLKITCSLDSFIENTVNDKFKLNVYRIIQEQLNNILKHANATDVAISLAQNKKFLKLTVADNGVGFDTGKKRKGIGVANIKKRAASYNGMTDFVSSPGHGCVLSVTFPFSDTMLNKY